MQDCMSAMQSGLSRMTDRQLHAVEDNCNNLRLLQAAWLQHLNEKYPHEMKCKSNTADTAAGCLEMDLQPLYMTR